MQCPGSCYCIRKDLRVRQNNSVKFRGLTKVKVHIWRVQEDSRISDPILEGLKKWMPKLKKLNMIQSIQQKPNEDHSEFLERIYQAYRKHTDADTENVWIVNINFIGQSAPDIRRKCHCLDRVLGINPSQLVDIVFKVYNAWETRKLKQTTTFLETGEDGPKRKRERPTRPINYTYCKEEGHWRKHYPKLKEKHKKDRIPCSNFRKE